MRWRRGASAPGCSGIRDRRVRPETGAGSADCRTAPRSWCWRDGCSGAGSRRVRSVTWSETHPKTSAPVGDRRAGSRGLPSGRAVGSVDTSNGVSQATRAFGVGWPDRDVRRSRPRRASWSRPRAPRPGDGVGHGARRWFLAVAPQRRSVYVSRGSSTWVEAWASRRRLGGDGRRPALLPIPRPVEGDHGRTRREKVSRLVGADRHGTTGKISERRVRAGHTGRVCGHGAGASPTRWRAGRRGRSRTARSSSGASTPKARTSRPASSRNGSSSWGDRRRARVGGEGPRRLHPLTSAARADPPGGTGSAVGGAVPGGPADFGLALSDSVL